MVKGGRRVAELDESRRALVRDNVGLVGTHLRQHVRGIGGRRGAQTWEELFQEGCLGLIRAAADYDERRGIAFAAFALPRIHRAVSSALQRGAVVRSARTGGRSAGGEDRHNPYPEVSSLSAQQADRLSARARKPPDPGEESGDTVGARLRRKYERAVKSATTSMTAAASADGSRRKLIRLVAGDRLLVPEETSRTSLRAIAEKTRSSFGRVADCERRLASTIKAALDADPEFVCLRQLAGDDVAGAELVVDREVDRELAHAVADAFVARFRAVNRKDRGRMIAELLDVRCGELVPWIRGRFSTMPDEKRELVVRRALRVGGVPRDVTEDRDPAC
jgi:DNA-directed RNA polymerase specialized sigma24 family protein